jgi:hypothetical protein
MKDYNYYVGVGFELAFDCLWNGFVLLFAFPATCVWRIISLPLWILGRLVDKL